MIFDIAFIVLLALFGVSAFFYGIGRQAMEEDHSPELVVGTNLAGGVAVTLFIVLMFMVVPL